MKLGYAHGVSIFMHGAYSTKNYHHIPPIQYFFYLFIICRIKRYNVFGQQMAASVQVLPGLYLILFQSGRVLQEPMSPGWYHVLSVL